MAKIVRPYGHRHRRRQGHRPALFARARRRGRARHDRRHRRRQRARAGDRRRARGEFGDQRHRRRQRRKLGQVAWSRPTMERFGRIDVLVNNAALFAPLQETKCTEIDADLWDKVMAVNLRGPFLMVKHVAPHMIAQRLRQDHQYRLGHRLSRHPVDAALRHQQGRHHGVHAGARARARRARHPRQHAGAGLHPERHGGEREPGPRARPPATAPSSRRSLRRDEHPQDLLGALVFLASADSDFITGQTLAVDGGNVNT